MSEERALLLLIADRMWWQALDERHAIGSRIDSWFCDKAYRSNGIAKIERIKEWMDAVSALKKSLSNKEPTT